MAKRDSKKTKTKNNGSNVVDLTTRFGPLTLQNPVLVASGTFGTGEEFADFFDLNVLGGIITKAVTVEERPGNPPPRTLETPAGLLNAIGLQNVGLDRFVAEKLPFLRTLRVPVIVNVEGVAPEEYRRVVARLTDAGGIAGFELNISCPNVKRGGIAFGVDPVLAAGVTRSCRKATPLPLIVKLSPNVTDILPIARAVMDAGADVLSLVNTFRGMAVDVRARKPALGNVVGGLSGPAIKPLALYHVYQVSSVLRVPILGMGGIVTAKDAVEFMMVGASAVAIGTANLVDPTTAPRVVDGLREWCRAEGLSGLGSIVGAALPEGGPRGCR
jgi:dihydroorotate dehydrogenase (NAD+) catalytic subunit